LDITAGATINIGCRNDHGSAEAYVDDFRFQPLNATTSAYVYDAFSGELSHILDNSNLYTRFEYDGAGRLTATYREKLGVGEYKTNEYQQNFSTTKFISAPIDNETYGRIGCPTGYNGSTSSITVPEGRFVSFISQADANAQADAYAQSEANRLGTCTPAGNIQLRNNIAADAEYYSDALLNKVDFIQGSTVVYTFSWPSGADTREAFTYVSVAPGTYTLRFYVDVGEPETARYYGFKPVSPTNLKWTRSQHDLSYTTYNTVTVSTGVSYTLTVASSSALAD
jgi:YD repeat-containing protein